jgi:hypothetical protein
MIETEYITYKFNYSLQIHDIVSMFICLLYLGLFNRTKN